MDDNTRENIVMGLIVALIIAGLVMIATCRSCSRVQATESTSEAASVISRVNALRTVRGLQPLAINETGCQDCETWARYLAGRGRLVHARGVSECIAYTSGDPVRLWQASYLHNRLLMGHYTRVSYGRCGNYHVLRLY